MKYRRLSKYCLFYLLFIVQTLAVSQTNPFTDLVYDTVVAYEFKGDGETLIDYCLKNAKERINNETVLSSKQIKEFETIITSKTAYGSTTAFCFDPHFAVVYFLKGKPVETIDVCLSCNYLVSRTEIPSTTLKYIKISDDYSYPANGFSSTARKQIYQFIKDLGFTKYLQPLNSIYDNQP